MRSVGLAIALTGLCSVCGWGSYAMQLGLAQQWHKPDIGGVLPRHNPQPVQPMVAQPWEIPPPPPPPPPSELSAAAWLDRLLKQFDGWNYYREPEASSLADLKSHPTDLAQSLGARTHHRRRPPLRLTRDLLLHALGISLVLGFLTVVHEHRTLWSRHAVAPASLKYKPEFSVFSLFGFGDEQMESAAYCGLFFALLLCGLTDHCLVPFVLWLLHISFLQLKSPLEAGVSNWELQTAESAGLAVLLCPLQLSLATYRGRTPSTVIMWLFRALAFRAAMGTAFASLHDSSSWESTEWSTSYGMFVASLLPSWMDAARVWIVRVLRLASPLPLMGPWRKARLLGAATLIALHVISMLCTGRLCDAMASLVPLIACLDDYALEAAVPWLRQPEDWRMSNSDGGPFSAVKSTFVRPAPGSWSVQRRVTALCQLILLACFTALSLWPLASLAAHARNFTPPVATRGGLLMLVNTYGDDSGLMSLPPEVQRSRFELVFSYTRSQDIWHQVHTPCMATSTDAPPCVLPHGGLHSHLWPALRRQVYAWVADQRSQVLQRRARGDRTHLTQDTTPALVSASEATMLEEIHLLTSERLTQLEMLSGDGGPAAYVSKPASEMCSSLVQGNAAAAAALGVSPQLILQPFPPRQLNVEVVEYKLTDFSQRWAGSTWWEKTSVWGPARCGPVFKPWEQHVRVAPRAKCVVAQRKALALTNVVWTVSQGDTPPVVHAHRLAQRDTLLLLATFGLAAGVMCMKMELLMLGLDIPSRPRTMVDTLLPLLMLDVCGRLASVLTAGAIESQVAAFSKRNHSNAERFRLRLPLFDVVSSVWATLYCTAVFGLARLDAHETVSIVSVLCLGGVFLYATYVLYRCSALRQGWQSCCPSLLALGLIALALYVFHILSRVETLGGGDALYATAQDSWTTTSVIRGPDY